MKLFPYTYRYETDEMVALFHPINMSVLYCRKGTTDDAVISYCLSSPHRGEWLVDDLFDFNDYVERILRENESDIIDIKTLKMFTTTRCNLNCAYCLIEKNLESRSVCPKNLSLEDGLSVLKQFRELTTVQPYAKRTIMLYGGEPMLNRDNLFAFIQYIRSHDFNGPVEIVLESNGTLITDDAARFLRNHDVFVIVSIDGVREVHDAYRKKPDGSGSWLEARRGFDTLIRNGCMAVVSSVFTDLYAKNVDTCLQFMTNELKPKSIGLNLFHVLEDRQIENDITENTCADYIHAFELARESGLYIEHIMRRIRPLVDRKIRIKDCGACGNRIVSDVDGAIGICEGFVGDSAYFQKRDSFAAIKEDPVFKKWSVRTPLRMEQCCTCPAIGICGAGCVSNALQQNRDIYSPDRYICSSSRAFIDWALTTWFSDNQIEKKLVNEEIHILEDTERLSLLGVLGQEFQIPLQTMSKQYEVKG